MAYSGRISSRYDTKATISEIHTKAGFFIKIEKLKASWFKYKLIFRQPAGTSRGVMHQKDTWFLKIWNEEHPENAGIGECSLLKGLSCDDRAGYELMLDRICQNINSLKDNFHEALIDWPSLRFGFEMALLDLQHGGNRILFPSSFTRGEKAIPINGLVWMGHKDFMLKQIGEKLGQGFTVIKMKVGAIDFETECTILQYIRTEYDQNIISIRLDANGAFSPDEVFHKLKKLSQYQIHSIEQPIAVGKPHLMAEVCRNSPIPVALDEELIGVHSIDEKRRLLEIIHPQFIILKPTLVGGFEAAHQWISLAYDMDIGWWVTSALESNIGLNAIAQWTATLDNSLPHGLGTGMLYTNNIGSPLVVRNGFLHYYPEIEWNLKFTDINKEPDSWELPLTLNGQTLNREDVISRAVEWENDDAGETWLSALGKFLKQWYSTEEIITVNTSGSTGKPKEIQLKKSAMIESAKATGEYLQLHNHPDALLCLSARFIAGMMMVVRAMVYKQNLICVTPDGNPLLHLTGENIPAFAAMVPAQVYNALNNPVSAALLKKMRTLIIGGGEIHPLLEKQLKSLQNAVYATFGMTETITHIALRRISGQGVTDYFTTLQGISVSVDNRGCLVIHAPHINPEPIITNDLVEIKGTEQFRWLGRYDNIINRGGIKLIPEMIEKKLAEKISGRFFIAPFSDARFGQVPVLIVEDETMLIDERKRLEESIDKLLTKIEKPFQIIYIRNFELTGSGKINRMATLQKIVNG